MNIYIGNLNNNVSEQELRNLFLGFGKVTAVNIIMDLETGQSKGFAFVEMDEEADALRAIKALHNLNFMSQYLEVNEARPKPQAESRFLAEAREKAKEQQNRIAKRGKK
jgi:RNA recognition motif-containing protein